jgi:hypothetical protein
MPSDREPRADDRVGVAEDVGDNCREQFLVFHH